MAVGAESASHNATLIPSREDLARFSGCDLPEPHVPIVAATENQVPVWAQYTIPDPVCQSLEGVAERPGCHIPYPDRRISPIICRRAHDQLTVRTEGTTRYGTCMPSKG